MVIEIRNNNGTATKTLDRYLNIQIRVQRITNNNLQQVPTSVMQK